MDISVIIPVYNTEPYLHECIESVIASTCFPRCEVLLVNDGSTDGSEAVLQEYAQRYENIRCLDYGCPPWNRGGSAARNLGIEQAKGTYLFFLDSDDAIQPDYLEALYRAAEEKNCEIVYGGFSRWDGGITPVERSVLNASAVMTGRDFLNRRMDVRDEHNYLWCALYRMDFLRQKQIRLDGSVLLYEDILFFWETASRAERVCTVEEYGYLYRVREGSLVQNGVRRRDMSDLAIVLEKLSANPPSKELYRLCFMVVSMYLYYLGVLTETKKITVQEQKNYYQRLSGLALLPRLKWAASTRNEKMKWLLWRINWKLFYPLVKK